MVDRETAEETLYLLAAVAKGLGAKISDYKTPAERIAAALEETPGPARGHARVLQVMQAVEAAGGEAG